MKSLNIHLLLVMWVANSLDFNKNYDASVFETTIRVVGGLLSAFDLSGDRVFLEKAKDIVDRLLPVWDTPSGIPCNIINLAHGNAHNPGWIVVFLSEYKYRKKKRRNDGILSKNRLSNYLDVLRRVNMVFETGDVEVKAMVLVLFGY